jgi:hypothetical protein
LEGTNLKLLKVGKKLAITLSVLLVLTILIMVYILQKDKKVLFTDPYKVIPEDACIVIEAVNLRNFLGLLSPEKGLFGELIKYDESGELRKKISVLSELLNKQDFNKILNDGRGVISFFCSDNKKPESMLSAALPAEIGARQVKAMLRAAGISNFISEKKDGIQGIRVPFTLNGVNDTVYISLLSGLIICSESKELLSRAILLPATGRDVRNNTGFQRVLQTSGKNENKLFLVFKNLSGLVSRFTGIKDESLTTQILKLADGAGIDIFIKEDGLVLSGYTESSDSSQLLFKYKTILPKEIHSTKILPASTVLFKTVIRPEAGNPGSADSSLSESTYEFIQKLNDYTGDEITEAYIPSRDGPEQYSRLVFFELSNQNVAEQYLSDIFGTKKKILWFEPDDQIKIPVYNINLKGFIDRYSAGFAEDSGESFYTFYNNFLIIGSSFESVSKVLYNNLLNKTLGNDPDFKDFQTTLPSHAGYFFYCVPVKITNLLETKLSPEISAMINTRRDSLGKIKAAGYQLASSNGMIYNSLSVRFSNVISEEKETEWETLLDTVAAIKPFFFTNHISGAKEIFIQDIRNNAYLINSAGRVLWKVPLNERITGTVYMIDYYKNGKYQLLFSGKNYLHLIDRNGNYVERYPVKLRSPATNSLALFDYDKNLNYRLFIAGEDRIIYSYDKSGNVTKGWKQFQTAGIVRSEINYFEVAGKDYLVVSDETSLYFLDRAGNTRLNLSEPVTRAEGSALKMFQSQDPFLICTSPDGIIQQISFTGEVRRFSLKKFSADHSFDFFDMDGDGFGEYVFIDKGILYLYNNNKSEIFTRKFNSVNLGRPLEFIFSATNRKIGVVDLGNNRIFLIGEKGDTMKGFPLSGVSMFSIGKLSENGGWNLIVGGTDRFLYNYKIDTE